MVSNVENAQKNTGKTLGEICEMLGTTIEKYEEAKELIRKAHNEQL